MFGVFLFLTYYLQQTLGFSPIQTGLAFLPMSAAIMVTATTATTTPASRASARSRWSPTGMVLAAVAMLFFTQLDVDSTYAAHVLPGPAAHGPRPRPRSSPRRSAPRRSASSRRDAGVASAMVNTEPAGRRLDRHRAAEHAGRAAPSTQLRRRARHAGRRSAAQAAVHGYTTAF